MLRRGLSAFIFLAAAQILLAGPGLSVKVSIWPKEGWMEGGWGKLMFEFSNPTERPLTVSRNRSQWQADGRPVLQPWTKKIDMTIEPGKTAKLEQMTWFNPQTIAQAQNGGVTIKGDIEYKDQAAESTLDYEVEIPVASLPEPLRKIEGSCISLNLTESRLRLLKDPNGVLDCLDRIYLAMADLAGRRPYNGKVVEFKECPRHFAWAYAGNPISLNTRYVQGSVKAFDSGTVDFGWIHELGHDFDDGIGKWYNITGQWAEFSANFKLSYAYEKVIDGNGRFRVSLWKQGNRNNRPLGSGRQFNDGYFLMHGTKYLADPSRDWTTLESDEIHSFHTMLVREYGWDVFRSWYRTFVKLDELGHKPPADAEDKINLSCAILSQACGKDLSPVFKRWRMPVSPEKITNIKQQYPVEEHTTKARLEGDGSWAGQIDVRQK